MSELKKNTDVDESLGHLKLLLGCKVIAIKRILFEFDGELDWEEGPIVFLSKEEVWLLEDIRGGEEIKVTRVASDNARYCSRIAEVDEGYGRWTDVDVGCVEGYRDMIGNRVSDVVVEMRNDRLEKVILEIGNMCVSVESGADKCRVDISESEK